MKILFRADASIELGTGHVMRCLTLAETLKAKGAECQFVCGLQAGNMVQAIQEKGFKSNGIASTTDWESDVKHTLEACAGNTFDWIIVDHYGLDVKWEQSLRSKCHKLMVIDDLANRAHDCDLLLDQNLGRLASDYKSYMPNTCQLLIGPQYALLRPEFAQWREYSLTRRAANPELKHLLISMGGTDYPNSTSQILEALKQAPLPTDCHITVVMGASSPWIQQVRALAKTLPWDTAVNVNVNNMAELMANSDLSIGAAGSTSWERCALGLPSLVLILAENQQSGAKHLAQSDAAIVLELTANINHTLSKAITHISNVETLQHMSNAASQLTIGQGASCVSSHFYHSKLREMQYSDLGVVLAWRNHPKIRSCMHSQDEISLNEHQNWFAQSQQNNKKHLLIFECNGEALGFVNFTESTELGDADWGFYISPAAPKGTGKLMGKTALHYGFTNLKLKRIRGEVLSNNTVSQNFHNMLGFDIIATTKNNTVSFALSRQKYEQ